MKTNNLLKTLAILLAFAVSTSWAQTDWPTTAFTATDGDVIRIVSTGTLGLLTVPEGATVTIISDGEEPIARTAELRIGIRARATVRWEAKIATSGTISIGNSLFPINAVNLSNLRGEFQVLPGAIIRQSGTEAGHAIASVDLGSEGRITILGGEVGVADGGFAINSIASNIVTVRGGIISAPNGRAVNIMANIEGGQIVQSQNWVTNNFVVSDGETIRITSSERLGVLTVSEGATVTVVSDGEEPIARNATLSLQIPTGATVKWKAKIATSGTANAVFFPDANSPSFGTFEVHEGAIIRQIGTGAGHAITGGAFNAVRITVLGGEVSAAGSGNAINSTGAGAITVSGGEVSALGTGFAINATNNTAGNVITIKGGVINAANQRAINSASGRITVEGGQIIQCQNWAATNVFAFDGEVIRITEAGTRGTLVVSEGATVTVVSDGEEPIARNATLSLQIPTGATVKWKAKIATSGTADALSITGNNFGTFEIHEGAIIRQIGTGAGHAITGRASITVLGGKVSAAGSGNAINTTNNANIITVSGGIVSAEGGRAISGSVINIDGGLMIARRNQSTYRESDVSSVVSGSEKNQTGGLIIAYPTSGLYILGRRGGLSSSPVEADISWQSTNGTIGIQYNENAFFATIGTQEFWNWNGTINNVEDLINIRNLVNNGENLLGKTITLANDIDLSGIWQPIGGLGDYVFRGTFDGNGKSISNLSIQSDRWGSPANVLGGLFGAVGADGQIKNLTVNVNSINVGRIAGNTFATAGGLAAVYNSTRPIENVRVNIRDSISASISGSAASVGSRSSAGGLVGWADVEITIFNSYSVGKVSAVTSSPGTGNTSRSGGLVGQALAANIINSHFEGDVSSSSASSTNIQSPQFGTNSRSGGLVGSAGTKITIVQSYFTGKVSSFISGSSNSNNNTSNSGGLIGQGGGTIEISNSYSTGNVSSLAGIFGTRSILFSGGLIGHPSGDVVNIQNSYTSCRIGATSMILYDYNEFFRGGISGDWIDGENKSVYFDLAGVTTPAGNDDLPAGIKGKTSAELRDPITFVGWDFTDIWGINANVNDGMPYLRGVGIGGGENANLPVSIRPRRTADTRYGIILENAIVSEVAKISVITSEPATINLRILDNLGNVVFTADNVGAGFARPENRTNGDLGGQTPPLQNAIVWDLTNLSGRFVANGTYLIIAEATGISGRRYLYSARIGVSK